MTDPHELLLVGSRTYLETIGQVSIFDHQRVITHSFKRFGESGENPPAVMKNRTCLTVHNPAGPDNIAAKGFSYGLMPETDTKNGNFAAEIFYHRY